MMYIFNFIFFSSCDNLEIPTSSFTRLHIFNKVINKSEIKYGNSIKISYPGNNILKLVRRNENEYELINHTKYLNEESCVVFSIDYECKRLGLILDAWLVVLTCFLISVFFLFVYKTPFGIFYI